MNARIFNCGLARKSDSVLSVIVRNKGKIKPSTDAYIVNPSKIETILYLRLILLLSEVIIIVNTVRESVLNA